MQRNMSYRKPVPIYVPSPPPSPQETLEHMEQYLTFMHIEKEVPPLPKDTFELDPEDLLLQGFEETRHILDGLIILEKDMPPLPSNLTDMDLLSLSPLPNEDVKNPPSQTAEKDIPPLPTNWREILAEKVLEDSTRQVVKDDGNQLPPVPETVLRNDATREDINSDIPKRNLTSGLNRTRQNAVGMNTHGNGSSYTTLPGSQISRGRGLPKEYRPPTPPLRSKIQRQSTQTTMNFEISTSHLDIFTPTGDSSSERYHYARTAGSLTASPSFRTERTAVSLDPSAMGWARGIVTTSDPGLIRPNNSYPVLLQKKAGGTLKVREHPKQGKSRFPRRLQNWMAKMWRLVVTCK